MNRFVALFLLLPACELPKDLTGTSDSLYLADVTPSECQGDPLRPGRPDTAETGSTDITPTATASVSGPTITVLYENLAANCCPTPGVKISQSETTLNVDMQDVTAESACACDCLANYTVNIYDVVPGAYTVKAMFNGATIGELPVEIAETTAK